MKALCVLVLCVAAATAAAIHPPCSPETLVGCEESNYVLSRPKRDAAAVFSIVAQLAPTVYEIIHQHIIKKSCGVKIDPGRVNDHYNNNMDNVQKLKDLVASVSLEAANSIHMKATGYFCDANYCQEMGPNTMGTMGMCKREYCVCENGVAKLEQCGWFKVFDPSRGHCIWTRQAMFCS